MCILPSGGPWPGGLLASAPVVCRKIVVEGMERLAICSSFECLSVCCFLKAVRHVEATTNWFAVDVFADNIPGGGQGGGSGEEIVHLGFWGILCLQKSQQKFFSGLVGFVVHVVMWQTRKEESCSGCVGDWVSSVGCMRKRLFMRVCSAAVVQNWCLGGPGYHCDPLHCFWVWCNVFVMGVWWIALDYCPEAVFVCFPLRRIMFRLSWWLSVEKRWVHAKRKALGACKRNCSCVFALYLLIRICIFPPFSMQCGCFPVTRFRNGWHCRSQGQWGSMQLPFSEFRGAGLRLCPFCCSVMVWEMLKYACTQGSFDCQASSSMLWCGSYFDYFVTDFSIFCLVCVCVCVRACVCVCVRAHGACILIMLAQT